MVSSLPGLIETIVTLEMAANMAVKIPDSLEQRIEKAGEIFIRDLKTTATWISEQ